MPVAGLRVLLLRCCVDTEKGLWCWRSCCQVCFFWGRLPIINQSSIWNGLCIPSIYCKIHWLLLGCSCCNCPLKQKKVLKQLRLVYNLQAIQQNPQPYKQGQTALKMQTRAICRMTEDDWSNYIILLIRHVQQMCRGNEDAEVQYKSIEPCWNLKVYHWWSLMCLFCWGEVGQATYLWLFVASRQWVAVSHIFERNVMERVCPT